MIEAKNKFYFAFLLAAWVYAVNEMGFEFSVEQGI